MRASVWFFVTFYASMTYDVEQSFKSYLKPSVILNELSAVYATGPPAI